MSRSSLDRKARATTGDSTTPARRSAKSRKPSVTRLVGRARTRSRADRSTVDQREPDGVTTAPASPVDATETNHTDAPVQFVHSTRVFTHHESYIEAHPDAPALCPQAVSRLARDLQAEDLADLLLPARSVAAVFERPMPMLFNIQASATPETRRPSPSDTFFIETHGRANRRPTDDLFRDTRSDADRHRAERSPSAPEIHDGAAKPIAAPTRPKTQERTAKNSESAISGAMSDAHPVRTPRIVEPAISHTEPPAADNAPRPTRTRKRQQPGQAAAAQVERDSGTDEPQSLNRDRTRVAHRINLPGADLGTDRHITVVEYGQPGSGPKVYLQAGLHADETTGVAVLNQLMRRLDSADRKGEFSGHCVIVPVANPISASQRVHGLRLGQTDLDSGEPFNSHYPRLLESVAELATRHLRGDPHYDRLIVRGALRAALGRTEPLRPVDHLRHTLLSLACDADLVLDLHSKRDALTHLYLGSRLWPQASDLHRQMQSRATLLAESASRNRFDDTIAGVWWDLADRLQNQHVIEACCLAATLELNGRSDRPEQQATHDADNLYRFLQRRGVLAGDPGPLPEPLCNPTPLNGVEEIRADRSGVVTFLREPGEFIRVNDTVAVIDDPLTVDPNERRSNVVASTSGMLFARTGERSARPGEVLCRIAGPSRLA